MPQILPDDKFAEDIDSLNAKQREVFNVVYTWAKDYVQHDGHNVEPSTYFFRALEAQINLIWWKSYATTLKTLLYHFKYPEKSKVLLFGPTGISAVIIGGTTIHSGLGIKPVTKLLGLSDRSKATLRNRLSEVKFFITDQLSMASSNLWTDIDSRLGEIFMIIPEKAFTGLSIMTVEDLLQLPPVRGKLIFS